MAKLECDVHNIERSGGIIHTNLMEESDLRVIMTVHEEDVWPHTILDDKIPLACGNHFIRRRMRQLIEDEVDGMQALLFGYPMHFLDRPVFSKSWARIQQIIATRCVEDTYLAKECELGFTPVRQAAMKLEDIQCEARREFDALVRSWHGVHPEHHERQVKSNLTKCAYDIYQVYRALPRNEDIAEATHAAASALIFMIDEAVIRTRRMTSHASLWEELSHPDYDRTDPQNFWTYVFFTFGLILDKPMGLKDAQRRQLSEIHGLVQDWQNPLPRRTINNILAEIQKINNILAEMDDIIQS